MMSRADIQRALEAVRRYSGTRFHPNTWPLDMYSIAAPGDALQVTELDGEGNETGRAVVAIVIARLGDKRDEFAPMRRPISQLVRKDEGEGNDKS